MAAGRRKTHPPRQREAGDCSSSRIGALLLSLHHALRQVEQCRRILQRAGFSNRRWQEIVNDVHPDLRFALRPRLLDAIVNYLESAGQPVHRDVLADELTAQGAGLLVRVRQSITANLRNKSLALFSGDRIGLPHWKKGVRGSR